MADTDYVRLGCAAEACAGEHKAQGYCLRHYRQWQRGGVKKDATHCAHCDGPMAGKMAGAVYCSRRCKHAAWVKANPDRVSHLRQRERQPPPRLVCKVWAAHCEACGQAFVARRPRRYCGEACRPSSEYVSIAPDAKVCKQCGTEYKPGKTGGRPREYCSEACADQVARQVKRVHRLRRKAAKRAATTETVDPLRVFERDGWRCRLCGVKTPKAKRGSYEDDAPELDHIVPLSKGGEHSYRNTQCACRRCNGAKSDRALGQLLLIG